MKVSNIIGAIVLGIVAFSLAEPFFIWFSHPMRGPAFVLVALMFVLIFATGYLDLGFGAGVVLTIVFLAITFSPFALTRCLNEAKERTIKQALANPERKNLEAYLDADNSLWALEPSELKFCRMQYDFVKPLKELVGFD